ncbi:SixA phosphatase family protein [Brevibacterium ihuae]|uniref:SixA phosphatase family protein n=1 Tax=Brevibacterium ihuae TaxID=1631743 RepID=UPI000C77B55C|nr:histidine phosphatase family protein [Brevibacterium ihuae]
MPVLVLARHAKAARPPVADVDRPLTEAGEIEAARAGEHLAGLPLTHLVASAALRTVQTGEAVVAALGRAAGPAGREAPRLLTDRALYESGIEYWLEVIRTIPAEAPGAYIVGHEPTVSAVIGHLCPGFGVPERFRPSSIAVFDLPSWDVEPGDYPTPEIRCFRDASRAG